MEDILFSKVALPTHHPLTSDEEFLTLVRRVDRVYQSASRWLLQEPYLWSYASRAYMDIRGYYYLQKEPDLDHKLLNFRTLDAATQDRLTSYLVSQCMNSRRSARSCREDFQTSLDKSGSAKDFYTTHHHAAQRMYQAFFDIQNPRPEAIWDKNNPHLFLFPFTQHVNEEVNQWLADNIQDEWRLDSWELQLDFRPSGSKLAYVVFVPGATPNVDGLGGSRITMDANRSIHEYTSRWTIRHEYGHVLGFPDCYIEFYDSEAQVMINYQIDITNLMCSRRGKLQPLHLEELRQHYFRN